MKAGIQTSGLRLVFLDSGVRRNDDFGLCNRSYEYASVFAKQCVIIGWTCGLYSKEYLANLQAKGMDLPAPDFGSWLLVTCIGKVKHENDKNDPNKFYARVGFDYKLVNPVRRHVVTLCKQGRLSTTGRQRAVFRTCTRVRLFCRARSPVGYRRRSRPAVDCLPFAEMC